MTRSFWRRRCRRASSSFVLPEESALLAASATTISAMVAAFMRALPSQAAVSTATYKATLSPVMKLLHYGQTSHQIATLTMASTCSTSLLVPSFPMKFVPYIPQASKPRPKSKAKSMATTKTTAHSHSGVGSSNNNEEWFHIDGFPMPDTNALRSLDPAVPAPFEAIGASSSLDHGISRHLIVASQ